MIRVLFTYGKQFNQDVITLIFFEDVSKGGTMQDGVLIILPIILNKMIVGYPNLNYSDSDPRG